MPGASKADRVEVKNIIKGKDTRKHLITLEEALDMLAEPDDAGYGDFAMKVEEADGNLRSFIGVKVDKESREVIVISA